MESSTSLSRRHLQGCGGERLGEQGVGASEAQVEDSMGGDTGQCRDRAVFQVMCDEGGGNDGASDVGTGGCAD